MLGPETVYVFHHHSHKWNWDCVYKKNIVLWPNARLYWHLAHTGRFLCPHHCCLQCFCIQSCILTGRKSLISSQTKGLKVKLIRSVVQNALSKHIAGWNISTLRKCTIQTVFFSQLLANFGCISYDHLTALTWQNITLSYYGQILAPTLTDTCCSGSAVIITKPWKLAKSGLTFNSNL